MVTCNVKAYKSAMNAISRDPCREKHCTRLLAGMLQTGPHLSSASLMKQLVLLRMPVDPKSHRISAKHVAEPLNWKQQEMPQESPCRAALTLPLYLRETVQRNLYRTQAHRCAQLRARHHPVWEEGKELMAAVTVVQVGEKHHPR